MDGPWPCQIKKNILEGSSSLNKRLNIRLHLTLCGLIKLQNKFKPVPLNYCLFCFCFLSHVQSFRPGKRTVQRTHYKPKLPVTFMPTRSVCKLPHTTVKACESSVCSAIAILSFLNQSLTKNTEILKHETNTES